MRPRSYLYVPGSDPALMRKALESTAEAVVLDLEDAVSANAKQDARRAVAAITEEGLGRDKDVFVRLNAGAMALEDLDALGPITVTGFRIAKAEEPDQIETIAAVLDRWDDDRGPQARPYSIEPIIESVLGLSRMAELSRASGRIRRFAFGAGDFVHDLGGRATPDRVATLFARGQIVLQSRLLSLWGPVAHVYSQFRDLEGLRRASMEDAAMGFTARACIHPAQIDVIHDCFGYTDAQKRQAETIVSAFRARASEGIGSFALDDGTFVDEAVYKRAQRIVDDRASRAATE